MRQHGDHEPHEADGAFPTETERFAEATRPAELDLADGDVFDLRIVPVVKTGEVVRLCLTNTANTRAFNVRPPGARMKLVGGDSGRYERAELVEEVLLAPSERTVVDVLFDQPGRLTLEHRTPRRTYSLATITVTDERAAPPLATEFEGLRSAPELVAERQRLDSYLAAPPDKTLALVAEMDDLAGVAAGEGAVVYACPMHPEVTSDQPGRCPACGMKLLATPAAVMTTYTCPMHPEVTSDRPGRCPACGMKLLAARVVSHATAGQDASAQHDHNAEDHHAGHAGQAGHAEHEYGTDAGHGEGHEHGAGDGIEWEDDMVEVNRLTTAANMFSFTVARDAAAAR